MTVFALIVVAAIGSLAIGFRLGYGHAFRDFDRAFAEVAVAIRETAKKRFPSAQSRPFLRELHDKVVGIFVSHSLGIKPPDGPSNKE